MRLLRFLIPLVVIAQAVTTALLGEPAAQSILALFGTIGLALGGASVLSSLLGPGQESFSPFSSPNTRRQLRDFLNQGLMAGANAFRSGAPQFEGQLAAPLGPQESQLLQFLFGGQAGPASLAGLQQLGSENLVPQILADFTAARRPGLEQNIDLLQSAVREGASARGTLFGTGSAQLETDAIQRLLAQESAIAAPLAAQLTGQATTERREALSQIPQSALLLSQVAALPRSIEQMQLQRQLEEFRRTTPTAFLPFLAQILGGSVGGSTQQKEPGSGIAPALGGLANLFLTAGLLQGA